MVISSWEAIRSDECTCYFYEFAEGSIPVISGPGCYCLPLTRLIRLEQCMLDI